MDDIDDDDDINTKAKVCALVFGLLESFREASKLEPDSSAKKAWVLSAKQDFEREASKISLFTIKLSYEAERGIMVASQIGCFSSKKKAEDVINGLNKLSIDKDFPKINLFAVSGDSVAIINQGMQKIEGGPIVFNMDMMIPEDLKKAMWDFFNKSNL